MSDKHVNSKHSEDKTSKGNKRPSDQVSIVICYLKIHLVLSCLDTGTAIDIDQHIALQSCRDSCCRGPGPWLYTRIMIIATLDACLIGELA